MKDGVPFAIDANGIFRDVEEVENGLSCGCFCADCRGPVVAKQGELRAYHFAHHHLRDCRHALEASIFGKVISQLTKPGFPLFMPAAGSRRALLAKERVVLRAGDGSRYFAQEAIVPETVQILTDPEVTARELSSSSLEAPDIRFPSIGLEIHLLSHQKKAEDVRSLKPGTSSILAIDLRAYAKIWWETCDAFRHERIQEAMSATQTLIDWLTKSGNGREWIHHATLETQVEILRSWIHERSNEYSVEATRLREHQARVEADRAAVAAALQAERDEARRKAEAAKAAARNLAWRAPIVEGDQNGPVPVAYAKLAAPNAWLSTLLAAEADLYWSEKYRCHACVIRPGEWVSELAQAHISKEAAWIPIYPEDMLAMRRERDSIRSRR